MRAEHRAIADQEIVVGARTDAVEIAGGAVKVLGVVGAVVGGYISTLFGFGRVDGFNFGSFVVAVIVGLVKEMYDNGKSGDHFCKWDLVADILGALGGVSILL